MTSEALVFPDTCNNTHPKRAYEVKEHTFSAETDGPIINKLGFGLLGISWPAGSGTLTFNVGVRSGSLRAHDGISIDASSENATSISDLAEWPFVQPIFSSAVTGVVPIALS